MVLVLVLVLVLVVVWGFGLCYWTLVLVLVLRDARSVLVLQALHVRCLRALPSLAMIG